MDKLFFDTSSLLMLAKEDIEKYAPIIISSISLKELENIKNSNYKSDEIYVLQLLDYKLNILTLYDLLQQIFLS